MKHSYDNDGELNHEDGSAYSNEERYAFFEHAEQCVINQYKNNRANHFVVSLSVGAQLDMLWHEVDTTGTITKDGEWFNAVKAVKDAHPKPTGA